MNTLSAYVDISKKSLIIALGVFFVVAIISKFALDHYNKDAEEKRNTYVTILYSVLIGLVCAFLSLLLFKQFGNSSEDIFINPFPKTPLNS